MALLSLTKLLVGLLFTLGASTAIGGAGTCKSGDACEPEEDIIVLLQRTKSLEEDKSKRITDGAAQAPQQTRCGCAANLPPGSVSCDFSTAASCGACPIDVSGSGVGCPTGVCPFAGVARDGFCIEPGGTHTVCATVNASTLAWFASVGNDLSPVVTAGGGWCLCTHWTKGAICDVGGPQLTPQQLQIDWSASDLTDPQVVQIKAWAEGTMTTAEICDPTNGPIS